MQKGYDVGTIFIYVWKRKLAIAKENISKVRKIQEIENISTNMALYVAKHILSYKCTTNKRIIQEVTDI